MEKLGKICRTNGKKLYKNWGKNVGYKKKLKGKTGKSCRKTEKKLKKN